MDRETSYMNREMLYLKPEISCAHPQRPSLNSEMQYMNREAIFSVSKRSVGRLRIHPVRLNTAQLSQSALAQRADGEFGDPRGGGIEIARPPLVQDGHHGLLLRRAGRDVLEYSRRGVYGSGL